MPKKSYRVLRKLNHQGGEFLIHAGLRVGAVEYRVWPQVYPDIFIPYSYEYDNNYVLE